ncbi:MAG TPA: XrtA/PEP-CTERM system histidine kinase PrsK [Casimicrobiaceae bacterium]|nr:XrtA/PEP-CTERM system histidine kinase PrsK [Casimicrobiaceae bacterium]
MDAGTFATATAWSYGAALVVYLGFSIRVSIGTRTNARARLLLAALLATAIWAALCLPVALAPSNGARLAADVADVVRYGAWYLFVFDLMRDKPAISKGRSTRERSAFVAVAAVLVASVLLGIGVNIDSTDATPELRAGFVLRLILAVFGLALTEQVLRRVQPQMRWGIKPLAVALAGVFGFELLLYADAMLFGRLDPDIWVARGFANVIVLPFIAVATARNTGWTVDLHLSRRAVFHSTALLVSGAFLLAVAGAGYVVRFFGGAWGRALQIEVLFASLLLVVLIASSGRFRSKLKVFVSKHFFSYRYDYREEWLRFTRTLSIESAEQNLQVRTIVALADLVESPAGTLFMRDVNRGMIASARWNHPAADLAERSHSSLTGFLERTGWIVSVPEYRADAARYPGLELPTWLAALPSPWLIVPLMSGSELLGFVVLMTPRTTIDVDWEIRDLLKTASRQAASYLGQVRASEALLEARKFDAFNRMSAFVVHDLKNLISQLTLMLKNAQRHRDNPAFQADMLATVEHVVGRMNGLMLQLRTGSAQPVDSPRHVDVDALVRRVCATKSASRVIDVASQGPLDTVAHEDRLEHVIGHLLQNAIDATTAAGSVSVSVERRGTMVVIVVADTGRGMTHEFVRDRLFKPFETTKSSGMGIGVYESVQYVSSIGGEISIDSKLGEGTTVEVRLPSSDISGGASQVEQREHVA